MLAYLLEKFSTMNDFEVMLLGCYDQIHKSNGAKIQHKVSLSASWNFFCTGEIAMTVCQIYKKLKMKKVHMLLFRVMYTNQHVDMCKHHSTSTTFSKNYHLFKRKSGSCTMFLNFVGKIRNIVHLPPFHEKEVLVL